MLLSPLVPVEPALSPESEPESESESELPPDSVAPELAVPGPLAVDALALADEVCSAVSLAPVERPSPSTPT